MTDALRDACRKAVHVITDSGEILRAGRAVLFVLEEIGFYPAFMRLLAHRPFIFAVEWGYAIVARHRSFFARILFRR